jgi:hypothetical protein
MGAQAVQRRADQSSTLVSTVACSPAGPVQRISESAKAEREAQWENIERTLDALHEEFGGTALTPRIAFELESIRTVLNMPAENITAEEVSKLDKWLKVVSDWLHQQNPHPEQAYFYFSQFTVKLPAPLDGLELRWVKNPEFYTENGWMSDNLHLDLAASSLLGAPRLVSIHSIIAIKEGGGVVRINPHVTVRDQKRQMDRQVREQGLAGGKKSVQDRNEDKEDALYSKQVGMKSVRSEKNGEASKLETAPLETIFTEEWLRSIVVHAIAAADPRFKYEIGTRTHDFKEQS